MAPVQEAPPGLVLQEAAGQGLSPGGARHHVPVVELWVLDGLEEQEAPGVVGEEAGKGCVGDVRSPGLGGNWIVGEGTRNFIKGLDNGS